MEFTVKEMKTESFLPQSLRLERALCMCNAFEDASFILFPIKDYIFQIKKIYFLYEKSYMSSKTLDLNGFYNKHCSKLGEAKGTH